jgi:hypothetical protein
MSAAKEQDAWAIYPRRWSRAVSLAVTFAVLAALFALWLLSDRSGVGAAVGWLSLAAGGCGLVTCAWEVPWLLRRGPVLVIDERGVTDLSSPFAIGFIPREEITAVLVCRHWTQPRLGIRVRDRGAILDLAPVCVRWVHRLRGPVGPASFVTSNRLTGVSAERLAAEFCERYGVPAGIALPGDD